MLRIVFVLLSVVLAGGAAILTQRQLARIDPNATPTVDVLVATKDLSIGHILTAKQMAWQPWPKDRLHGRYVRRDRNPDAVREFDGAAVRQQLAEGDPITEVKVVRKSSSGVVAIALDEGKRAVTIKVDEAQGLAGLLKPGDRVDVVLTHKVKSAGEAGERGAERTVSEVVAAGVRVMAVGQEFAADAQQTNGGKLPKSVTVEVDGPQAEAIILGRTLGTLSLALRSAYVDDGEDERQRVRPWTSNEDVSGLLRQQRVQTVRVLATARPLPAGTLLGESDLRWVEISVEEDDRNLFAEGRDGDHLGKLRGALLTRSLDEGDKLERRDVVRPGEARFVPSALRRGHRAVSVAIAPNTAVGGFVTPGDLVDVVFTDEVDDHTSGAVLLKRQWSETVAEAVRVLSIETSLDPATNLPKAGGTATLEATPDQAQAIALAAAMGKLTLTLRPVGEEAPTADRGPTAVGGVTLDTTMSRGLRRIVGGTDGDGPRGDQIDITVIKGGAPQSVRVPR